MWYLFHVAPIENEENVVVLFLVTVRDISEFKEPIAENGEAFLIACLLYYLYLLPILGFHVTS